MYVIYEIICVIYVMFCGWGEVLLLWFGKIFEYIFVYKNKMWKNFLFVKYLFWGIGRLFEGSYLKYFEIEGIK